MYEAAYERLDPDWQVRLDLAVAHRWASRWRWNEGVVNHFTALVPGYRDRFFAIPYGLHWDEVKARDFLVVDLNGNVLDANGEIELTSLLIHGAMHRDLPQARVILHTHQPHITALTCLENPTVEMCSQLALHFAGRIAYLNTYGLATERSIGKLICDAIGEKSVISKRAQTSRPVAVTRIWKAIQGRTLGAASEQTVASAVTPVNLNQRDYCKNDQGQKRSHKTDRRSAKWKPRFSRA